MSGQWKPGDVAMVTWDNASGNMREHGRTDITTSIGLRRDDDWGLPGFGCSIGDGHVTEARPLVVIDPEDNPYERGTAAWIDWIEEQYLAQSRPPKPEEPTGLGAVVEAANGDRWVRVEALGDPDHIHVWVCEADDEVNPRRWEDVYAVKVLSEGVTP